MCIVWINRLFLTFIFFLCLSAVAAGTPSVVKKSNKSPGRSIVVVIDPGHGGKDSGAIGKAGYQEKTLALAVSKQLQRLLNQDPRFRAELTRTKDIYLPLRERLKIAQRY